MARLPNTRRFTVEDFKSQKEWIGPFFEQLNPFISAVNTSLARNLTFSENLDAQIVTLKVRTNRLATLGSLIAVSEATFLDADVNTGTEVLTIAAHGLETGTRIRLSTTGVLPTGLTASTDYFVVSTGANTLQLATSFENAINASVINITAAAGGGTHTLTRYERRSPYVELFEAGFFKVTTRLKPTGVWVLQAVESVSNPVRVAYAMACDWSYEDGLVRVHSISGLDVNSDYLVTLVSIGG